MPTDRHDDYGDEHDDAYEDGHGDEPARDQYTDEGTDESDVDGWLTEGLAGTLLLVGVVLFFFPEPATSGIGVLLLLLGGILWLLDAYRNRRYHARRLSLAGETVDETDGTEDARFTR